MSGEHSVMGLRRISNRGVKCMSKPLKDYDRKMWLAPGNKADLSCMSLSIAHGYRQGWVDANILISDGGDSVYIDCSLYKPRSNKKKIDLMIKALEEFKARFEEFEAAAVDISQEIDTTWQQ